MKRCFIFAAGTFYGLRKRPESTGDFIIAADAGYRICQAQRIVPNLLLGDFDSMTPPADFPASAACRWKRTTPTPLPPSA